MKTTKQKSFRQETRLAQRYGGSVTPGSGNGWVKKNDVRTPDLSIEAKYTDAKSFSLKQADLHTAERHALMDGRDSVFIISFAGEEWAVVREEDYREKREFYIDRHQPCNAVAPDRDYPHPSGDALVLGPEIFAAFPEDADKIRIAYKGVWFMPIPPQTPAGTCDLPPDGWYCSRDAGHDGPCPTWEQPMLPGADKW